MLINTQIDQFTIRPASADDCGLILNFIQELAEYEKLSHEVVATEAQLKTTLFGPKKIAEVIIGEYRNEAAAFALFFHNYSTFLAKPGIYLEDLYVRTQFRGKGFGKTMLSYLAYLAQQRDCGRLEWWVLDWNEPAIDFYTSLHAKPMDEWTSFRLTGSALERLAGLFKNKE